MTNRTSPGSDAPGKPAIDHTRKTTGEHGKSDKAQATAPKLPHDADESVGMTDGAPSEVIRQGGRDLERGLTDTSRAPEADKAYQKQK